MTSQDLRQAQEAMRARILAGQNSDLCGRIAAVARAKYTRRRNKRFGKAPAGAPPPPVDQPVLFTEHPVQEMVVANVMGVYILHENGQYYIGESVHVGQRFCNHQYVMNEKVGCKMENPRGCVLMELEAGASFQDSKRLRLVAERRFIRAALKIGLRLTNNLSEDRIERLLKEADELDLFEEFARLRDAAMLLAGGIKQGQQLSQNIVQTPPFSPSIPSSHPLESVTY
jgi:hypothetical protein